MLDDVALDEDRGDVGIEPDRVHHRRQAERVVADHSGRLGDRERVQVDDAVERVDECWLSAQFRNAPR